LIYKTFFFIFLKKTVTFLDLQQDTTLSTITGMSSIQWSQINIKLWHNTWRL